MARRPYLRAVAVFLGIISVLGRPALAGGEEIRDSREPSASQVHHAFDLSAAYLTGDFGTDTTTDVYVLSPRFRWFLPRAEFRVTIPFLYLSNSGNVTLIAGQPASGQDGSSSTPAGPGTQAGGPGASRIRFREEFASGLGDVLLQGEAFFVTGTSTRPWFTGLLKAKLPTADEDQGLGTGEADVEVGLDLIQPLGDRSLLLSAGYARVGDLPDFNLDDIVRVGAGMSWRVGDTPGKSLYLFLENRTNPVPGLDDRLDLTLGGSARFGADRSIRLSGAVLVGLSDTAEDVGASVTLGREF